MSETHELTDPSSKSFDETAPTDRQTQDAPTPITMADVLRGRLGGFRSGSGQLAQLASELFSIGMQAKKKSGHL